GPDAVNWILDHHPDLLRVAARAALLHRPERVIPILLNEAVGDDRELHAHPEHPLRLIQDWVKAGRPGTVAALRRRRALFDATLNWTGLPSASAKVSRRALAIAFSLEYEVSPVDLVDPRRFRSWMGHLTDDEMAELRSWWPEAVDLLTTVGVDEVHELENVVRQWAFPGMLRGTVSDSFAAAAKAGARIMLEDLARIGENLPGIVGWASRLGVRAGLELRLPTPIDPVFEILFPPAELGDDWQSRHARQSAKAKELG